MSDYTYLKELDFDGTIVPVGHYNISTWCSESDSNVHVFTITSEPSTTDGKGVLIITCVSSNKSCVINIPLKVTMPLNGANTVYNISGDDDLVTKLSFMSTEKGNTVYRVQSSSLCSCNVAIQENISCKILKTTNMTGFTELKRDVPFLTLREGLDYGDELPAAGNKGRLFFVKL